MAKISKRTVDASHPSDDRKRYIRWDDVLKGFGLLVLPTGVKSYIYNYRTVEGRKRRATIGKVGTLTPEKARQLASNMSDTVREGGDPLADKAATRLAPTIGEIFDTYLDSSRFAEKAESTQAIDRGRIKRHLRPLLGRAHVNKLSPEDIRKAFNAIRSGKTAADVITKKRGRAIVKGGAGTARAAIRLLSSIFSWAIQEGLAKVNPTIGVSIGSDGQRDTILEGAEQYKSLFSTLKKMETEKRIREPVADAIRLIALTGARRGEITGALWSHVDLKVGTITLPPNAHKTGRKTGKKRAINLPSAAREVIARQIKRKDDDYVFQPAKGKGPVALSKPWRSVREEAELPEGIGLHGLRHSLASLLALDGAQAAEIMTVLGHRNITTSQKYVHFAENARSNLAERAAAPALAGLAAAAGETEADVVLLKRNYSDD